MDGVRVLFTSYIDCNFNNLCAVSYESLLIRVLCHHMRGKATHGWSAAPRDDS